MAAAPPPAPKPTLAELERNALTQQWSAFAARDLATFFATYAPDASFVEPGPGGLRQTTLADTKAYMESIFKAFPDATFKATRVFQKGDVVIYEWVATGTDRGGFMGDGPTGKSIGFRAATVDWFGDDGKIKHELNIVDDTTLAQQLGKMPGKARARVASPAGEPEWNVSKDPDAEAKWVETAKATWWPATWTKKDRKGYQANLGDGSAHYEIASPNDYVGVPALMAEYDAYAKALPDSAVTIDDAWAVGNVVILQFTFGGTMKGPIGPFKPTNRPLTIHGLDIDEVSDSGRMGNMVTYSNGLELLAGVGALPHAAPHAERKAPQ
jgi:steroid delta-isomerase-like uncharacterized protein